MTNLEKTIIESAKKGAQSGVKGGARNAISSIFKPVILLFSKFGWKLGVTMIFLSIIMLSATVQSISQKSVFPMFYEVGGRFVSADEMIYQDITKLRTDPSRVILNCKEGIIDSFLSMGSTLMFILGLISSIWFIYMNIIIINAIVKAINGSGVPNFVNLAWTIAILFSLQMIFSLSIFGATVLKADDLSTVIPGVSQTELDEMDNVLVAKTVLKNHVPFKGIMSLGGYVFDQISDRSPQYESIEQISDEVLPSVEGETESA